MDLKDILVHIDTTPQCATRLEVAVQLAQRHNARLTGLYVLTRAAYASRSAAADTQAEAMKGMFNHRTAAAGIAAEWLRIDWQVVGVSIGEIITRHAYYADLVVVGQTEAGKTGRRAADGIPERVILGSGRPVLTIPYAGTFSGIGQRIMVAWKAGRESTRALNDALPLLRAAREVTLATVAEAADSTPVPVSICDHLQRHGVPVRAEKVLSGGLPTADTLLNQVAEQGIDLLVTGAYGYTSKGIPELGEVAAQLLRSMTIPVLMSH